MPLKHAFGPEEVARLRKAYGNVIASLDHRDVSCALAEWVARKIMALGKSGELDVARLVARVRLELTFCVPFLPARKDPRSRHRVAPRQQLPVN